MDANLVVAVGKVEATPQVQGEGDGKQAFFNFLVNHREPAGNGQWVDKISKIPIYCLGVKANVVEKNVVAGQELYISGRLQTWDAGNGTLGFGVIIDPVGYISFGFKPRTDKQVSTPAVGKGPGGFPG